MAISNDTENVHDTTYEEAMRRASEVQTARWDDGRTNTMTICTTLENEAQDIERRANLVRDKLITHLLRAINISAGTPTEPTFIIDGVLRDSFGHYITSEGMGGYGISQVMADGGRYPVNCSGGSGGDTKAELCECLRDFLDDLETTQIDPDDRSQLLYVTDVYRKKHFTTQAILDRAKTLRLPSCALCDKNGKPIDHKADDPFIVVAFIRGIDEANDV